MPGSAQPVEPIGARQVAGEVHGVLACGPGSRLLAEQPGGRDSSSNPETITMASRQRVPAHFPKSRTDAVVGFGAGGIFLVGAVALLTLVASALRTGEFDVRPEHAPRSEPAWILASEDPLWFYGILALVTVFAAYLLVVSWRMIRAAWQER
jgi:hypothetical protein